MTVAIKKRRHRMLTRLRAAKNNASRHKKTALRAEKNASE